MRHIEISEETYQKIKDQLSNDEIIEIDSYDDFIGKKIFFRTVTYHLLGKVKKRIGKFFELEKASWIADSGRFMNFIKNGDIKEIEPIGQWFVNFDTVTDFGIWNHELPTEQK